jgi:hypothetical protein
MPYVKMADRPCRYGCKDPLKCAYAHEGCPHCKQVREGAAHNPVNADKAIEQSWVKTHPLPRPS